MNLSDKEFKNLLKRFSDNPEIIEIQEKYSKRTLNPIKIIKDKNSKKKELIEKLIVLEKERKRELYKNKVNSFKELISSNKTVVYVIAILSCVAISSIYITHKIKSTLRTIEFVDTPESQYVGDAFKFNYEIVPNTAVIDDNEISITYSDNEIIKDNILCSEGNLEVSVYYKNKLLNKMSINVLPVDIIDIKQKDILVGIGNELKVEPIFIPDNATYKDFELINYDKEIIEVKDNIIFGKEIGSTRVTIRTKTRLEKQFVVNVAEIYPSKIEIINDTTIFTVGDKGQIELRFSPLETTNRNVSYKTSNNKVISINEDGQFVALDAGETSVIVEFNENLKAEKTFVIKYPPCESIELSSNYTTLYIGNSTKLVCSFNPRLNSDIETLSFKSSDTSVLEVNEKGVVTAKALGKATIEAKCGNCADAIEISVVSKPKEPTSNGNSSNSNHIEGSGDVVYITPYGKKYHKDPSCPASNHVTSVTIDKLPSQYSEKCEKCWR